jgi:hypothetical protein
MFDELVRRPPIAVTTQEEREISAKRDAPISQLGKTLVGQLLSWSQNSFY